MGIQPIETVLQTLKLLIPALIPSWRFFDTIAPSPRIEFAVLETLHETASDWQEFRPRPARLSVGSMLKRMFWNPRWNETLFLVSCAERLMATPTERSHQHSSREIIKRLEIELAQRPDDGAARPYLQFRLVFLDRQGAHIEKHILFVSPVHRYLEKTLS